MTFASYIASIKAPIARRRAEQELLRPCRTSSGLTTEREIVENAFASGVARITCDCMTGKKVDGMRLPLKPSWTIWVGDAGIGITRTAAHFANHLLGDKVNVDEVEAAKNAWRDREISAACPERGQMRSGARPW